MDTLDTALNYLADFVPEIFNQLSCGLEVIQSNNLPVVFVIPGHLSAAKLLSPGSGWISYCLHLLVKISNVV
jgi:hypothetical protein